ncbi:MAG: DUF1501 domain-containing protein [Pseudomonadota bacterium]
MIDRRRFLKATCAGLGVGAGFASNLASFNAFASEDDTYKALVCVFLYGGMDAHDTIIPYDQSSSFAFERIRDQLLSGYDSVSPRRRSSLLALNGDLEGRTFGLPTELAPLRDLYNDGHAAVIGNIGPLIEPIERTAFVNGSGIRPKKLFSHNDQQSTWMASSPEGALSGWGGRIADALQAASLNPRSSFSAVSMDLNSIFVTGNQVQPFVTSTSGPPELFFEGYHRVLGSGEFSNTYQNMLRGSAGVSDNLFMEDVAEITKRSLDSNTLLEQELSSSRMVMADFPTSNLGGQLEMVAKIIERRESLGLKRQIFFVAMGGFDTHSGQVTKLPALQSELAHSLKAFYDATVRLGIEDQVTTFTASDFGRTLGVNGDGTDHGWGAHHFALGGAVNGGRVYGNIPPPEFGHDYDAGRGRLIPQIAVDQYASAFGRWFGLSETDLHDVIPGLKNFDSDVLSKLMK